MQGVGNITSSTIHQRTAAQIKEIQRRKKKLKVNMSQLKIYSIYRLQMPVLKSSLEQSDPQPQ